MYVATERGTSDNTEATRFSQCAHDQRRRLEAEDCDSIRCAQLISGGRRRIRPPRCLAHARPTMCCIRLVIYNLLYIISTICDRQCTSKIAINISIFHLGSYTRRARSCPDAERSAPPIFEATAHRGRAVNFSLCSSDIVLQI